MKCDNCRKDIIEVFIHENHWFCSQECKEEYYKDKKKIKCQRCGEIFYEVDLIIETKVVPNQPEPIGWDWGIPIWEEYEIRKCPKCKRILYYVGNVPSP